MSAHTAASVVVTPMSGAEDARAFRVLNEQWITALFALEDEDRRVLGDPQGEIVEAGGRVLMARLDGQVVGCVALLAGPTPGEYELAKMTVTPDARGHGIGRTLILAAIDAARSLGASAITLGSSTRLPDAVHLYESVGFVHAVDSSPFARADVFMRLELCRLAGDVPRETSAGLIL